VDTLIPQVHALKTVPTGEVEAALVVLEAQEPVLAAERSLAMRTREAVFLVVAHVLPLLVTHPVLALRVRACQLGSRRDSRGREARRRE